MNAQKWLLDQIQQYRDDPVFVAEQLIIEINEEICRQMAQENVNRAELARRLGVTRQFITKLLNGNPNLTVLTLVKIAVALGARVKMNFISGETPAHLK